MPITFHSSHFQYFPGTANIALEALKDEDVDTWKQAAEDLSRLCEYNREHAVQIAKSLTVMLVTTDDTELSVLHDSLMTFLKIDAFY
jgi:predicted YcjX-like family ATPase